MQFIFNMIYTLVMFLVAIYLSEWFIKFWEDVKNEHP
jgi:hypothetical protein